jgi:hypothetical protein
MNEGAGDWRVTTLKVEVYPSMRGRAYPVPNNHTHRKKSRT